VSSTRHLIGDRAFHEGRSRSLPECYHRTYQGTLKRYAELLPRPTRIPDLTHLPGPGAAGP